MTDFELKVLCLILKELVNTGRLHDGDTITQSCEVTKAVCSLVYGRGITVGCHTEDVGIKIANTTAGFVITFSHSPQDTMTFTVPHEPIDIAAVSYEFVAHRLIETVCQFYTMCLMVRNTTRMETLINAHLAILNDIKPFTWYEPTILAPNVMVVISKVGVLSIEVNQEVYYTVLASDLKPHAETTLTD